MAFSRPSCYYCINLKLHLLVEWPEPLPHGRMAQSSVSYKPEQIGQVFPVSPRNGLFKTILPLNLSYWLELCLPGEQLKALSPQRMAQSSACLRPEQWMCRGFPFVTDEWPFLDNLTNKIIILTQNSVYQETWTMNVKFLPQCHKKWPFQDHIPSITLPTQRGSSTLLVSLTHCHI